jgi:hypothetical protein
LKNKCEKKFLQKCKKKLLKIKTKKDGNNNRSTPTKTRDSSILLMKQHDGVGIETIERKR